MRNADDKIQDSDEAQISGLLASLKRVEAPGDFGFRVKARIASARPSTGRGSWLPASVAVAAPLGLVLAVGGYFTLTTVYSPATVSPPAVADLRPAELPSQDVIAREIAMESDASAPRVESENVEPANPMVQRPAAIDSGMVLRPSVRRTSSHAPSLSPGGGSKDFTSGIGTEIPPKGPNVVSNGSIPARDVLSTKGVDVGSGWTLGNVKKGSSAERSGLKAGDVVEAIDDKPVSDKTSFNGKVAGKSVRVRRDGKTVRIDLKP